LSLLHKKPIEAGEEEIARNRRARSAKLRAAERPPKEAPSLREGGGGGR
jgi:16S rRNA C1402 N4-methylase RsmH